MSAEQTKPCCGTCSSEPGADLNAFIAGLRGRMTKPAEPTPLPERADVLELREVVEGGDVVARFEQGATAAGLTVHRTKAADWPATVAAALKANDVQTVVIEAQPNTVLTAERAAVLAAALAGAGVTVVAGCHDETLFTVGGAVTGVVGAVAETGTLVCVSGSESARGMSLIPPVHVAVVAAEQIAGDLFDLFTLLEGWNVLPANINLISGPSKTADIEGILVTGVHGPGAVHVVVVE